MLRPLSPNLVPCEIPADTMKLYGTLTSPYVRRVRVVAAAVGVPFTMIDTKTEDGQAALRGVNPLWKVPTVEIDGQIIVDSRAIVEYLLRTRGHEQFRPVTQHGFILESNITQVVDNALDAAIRRFYLEQDDPNISAPYLDKEKARVDSAMAWIADRVHGPWVTDEPGFGFAELALYTTLDWMRFRKAYDYSHYQSLVDFMAAHAEDMAPTAPDAAG